MDEMRYQAMQSRIQALEERVAVLERTPAELGGAKAQELIGRYPRGMTKTEAAKELGVTRATIYCMLKDGRLKESDIGRVIAESAATLLFQNTGSRKKRRSGSRWHLRMGADNE